MGFDTALAQVPEHEAELIDTLRTLLTIDTSVPPGLGYDVFADALAERFAPLGFTAERVVVPPIRLVDFGLPLQGPRVNLVVRRGQGRPRLNLYAHVDVVPAGEGWSRDPFGGKVDGGRIYGRGVADNKGAIACLLVALRILAEVGLEPAFDLVGLFCADEELGQYPGLLNLAEQGYVRGSVLSLEGSQDPNIVEASMGLLDVRVTTHGVSAHSGWNFLGVNAVEAMVPILDELLSLKVEVERRESQVRALPSSGQPSPQATAMLNLDVIQGGSRTNVIPARCTVTIDRRYLPEEHPDIVLQEIQAAVDRGRARSVARHVTVESRLAYPAGRYRPPPALLARLRGALRTALGYRNSDFFTGAHRGSMNLAFLVDRFGLDEIVIMGIGHSDSNIHGPDENARVSDLLAYTCQLIYFLAAPSDLLP
jgi:succinyl-diaminopimelate desuccinylase